MLNISPSKINPVTVTHFTGSPVSVSDRAEEVAGSILCHFYEQMVALKRYSLLFELVSFSSGGDVVKNFFGHAEAVDPSAEFV